jgi:hypothetical protein
MGFIKSAARLVSGRKKEERTSTEGNSPAGRSVYAGAPIAEGGPSPARGALAAADAGALVKGVVVKGNRKVREAKVKKRERAQGEWSWCLKQQQPLTSRASIVGRQSARVRTLTPSAVSTTRALHNPARGVCVYCVGWCEGGNPRRVFHAERSARGHSVCIRE